MKQVVVADETSDNKESLISWLFAVAHDQLGQFWGFEYDLHCRITWYNLGTPFEKKHDHKRVLPAL